MERLTLALRISVAMAGETSSTTSEVSLTFPAYSFSLASMMVSTILAEVMLSTVTVEPAPA